MKRRTANWISETKPSGGASWTLVERNRRIKDPGSAPCPKTIRPAKVRARLRVAEALERGAGHPVEGVHDAAPALASGRAFPAAARRPRRRPRPRQPEEHENAPHDLLGLGAEVLETDAEVALAEPRLAVVGRGRIHLAQRAIDLTGFLSFRSSASRTASPCFPS